MPRGLRIGWPTTAVGNGGFQFFEDFNGSALNLNDWDVMDRPGDASNSEVGRYRPQNVTVSGGNLQIETKSESFDGYSYTSGYIQSKWTFTYGTVQARIKAPGGGAGPWPAFWLLGADCRVTNITSPDNFGTCNWPSTGSDEVDIFEILGGNQTQSKANWFLSGGGTDNTVNLGFDASAAFHLYELVWTSTSLTWKVDGSTVASFGSAPSTPMFIILNTAVGGAGGTPNPANLPVTHLVDYVKVI